MSNVISFSITSPNQYYSYDLIHGSIRKLFPNRKYNIQNSCKIMIWDINDGTQNNYPIDNYFKWEQLLDKHKLDILRREVHKKLSDYKNEYKKKIDNEIKLKNNEISIYLKKLREYENNINEKNNILTDYEKILTDRDKKILLLESRIKNLELKVKNKEYDILGALSDEI